MIDKVRKPELRLGEHLFICDRCGWTYYSSDKRIEWNGVVVCKDCYDPKHPTIGQRIPSIYNESAIRNARPDVQLEVGGGDRDGICQAQTAATKGALTINGSYATAGVATLPDERLVTIYADNSQVNRKFTIHGTNRGGVTIFDAVGGPRAGETVKSGKEFFTVTSVYVNGATDGDIEIGGADVVAGYDTI